MIADPRLRVGRGRRLLETDWPALLVGAACAGIVVSTWVRPPPLLQAAAAATALAGALVARDMRRLALAAAALAFAGLWWGTVRNDALERSFLVERLGQPASARVVVTGPVRRTPFALRIPAEALRFGSSSIRERVLLELPPERAPPQGAVLELRARPVAPRGPETGFDERGWLARRGVHVVLRGDEDWRIVGRRGGIGGVGDRLRAHVEATLARGTSGERRRLLEGIVLGEDSSIDTELRNAFQASGLMHLLAVSGQNVAIVAFGVVMAARILGLGRLVGEAVAIVVVLSYALAVGWQPSVVRAAVAGSLASLAWILARPRDRWHALALGALVLLVWMPQSALEPGFQLSFAAVATIFLVLPRMSGVPDAYPVPRGFWDVLVVAAACGLVTAPIVWLHFGRVALWTVPANVAAEPAMPPLISLSLAAAAIEPVLPGAATAFAWLAGWCAWWLALVARVVAGWPSAQVSSPVIVVVVAALVGAAALVRKLPRYRRRDAIACLVSLALTLSTVACALRPSPSWTPPTGLRVTFLDVGQGDSALVEAPGAAVLVDEGPPEADVAGQLRRLGIRSLTAVVLTHPQRDHIGGAARVLDRLTVGAVAEPGIEAPSHDRDAVLAAARRRGIPVIVVHAGEVFAARQARAPDPLAGRPGASQRGPEPARRRRARELRSDRRAAHRRRRERRHLAAAPPPRRGVEGGPSRIGGSRASRPVRACCARGSRSISVGAHNDYDHPRPETVAALAAVPGLETFRTDENGRVVVESDGRTLTVRSER